LFAAFWRGLMACANEGPAQAVTPLGAWFPAAGATGVVGGQDAGGGEAVEDFFDAGLLGALEGGSTCDSAACALDFSEWTVMAIR
jgi:hypothetical protein